MENLISALQIFQLFLIFCLVLLLGYLGYVMMTFKNFIPFVPTSKKVARKMVEKVALKPGEKACDLGSGSGSLIIELARQYPNNEITGYEIAPFLRFVSKIKMALAFLKNKKVKVINQDMFTVDLSQYDAIVYFLIPKAMIKLMPQLKQMKIGSRIVSSSFPLPSAEEWTEEPIHISERTSIFAYTKIK